MRGLTLWHERRIFDTQHLFSMKWQFSTWLRASGFGLLILVATASVYLYVSYLQTLALIEKWAQENPLSGFSNAVLHDTHVVVVSPSVLALGGVLLLMGLVFTVFPRAVAGLFGKR